MLVASTTMVAQAQKSVNRLTDYLDVNKPVDAQFIQVTPHESMEKYAALILKAKAKDPEWFIEHEKKGEAGTPLIFDEKLMTKEEYADYLKSWDKRKITPVRGQNGLPAKLKIELTKESNDVYRIYVSGGVVPFSALEYKPKTDSWISLFGELTSIDPINAPKNSSLRAWKGFEWKSEKIDGSVLSKQNVAIGRSADKKYGYLIYRFQQIANGKLMANQSYFMRFFPVKKEKK